MVTRSAVDLSRNILTDLSLDGATQVSAKCLLSPLSEELGSASTHACRSNRHRTQLGDARWGQWGSVSDDCRAKSWELLFEPRCALAEVPPASYGCWGLKFVRPGFSVRAAPTAAAPTARSYRTSAPATQWNAFAPIHRNESAITPESVPALAAPIALHRRLRPSRSNCRPLRSNRTSESAATTPGASPGNAGPPVIHSHPSPDSNVALLGPWSHCTGLVRPSRASDDVDLRSTTTPLWTE